MLSILIGREKNREKSILYVLLFCVGVLALHFCASFFGWYGAFANMDTILHFLGGAFLAYSWMVFRRWHWGGDWVSVTEYVFALLGFVLLGGVVWEIFEFLSWTYVPQQALLFQFYSATVQDLLGDLIMDALGGVSMFLLVRFYRNKR